MSGDAIPAPGRPNAAPLDGHDGLLLATGLERLTASLPGVAVRVRRARRTLLSLHRDRGGRVSLGIDPRVLLNPDHSVLIVDWVRRGGRGGVGATLRTALTGVLREGIQQRLAAVPAELSGLPMVGPRVDLAALAAAVHARWFSDLPMPAVAWARAAHRRLSAIRFGCYRRGPPARITIHPRLARPWVAQVFLEHVLFHELCHHRQACRPVRRERIHGPRFRAWEAAFPGHALALAWERALLPCLLDDAAPPWYGRQTPGSQP